MSKLISKIWHFLWPDFGLIFGLGLLLDNWGHNHALLILPAWVLFILSLEAFIRKVATTNGKE